MKKIIYSGLLFFLAETGLIAQPTFAPAGSTDWRVGGNTANVNNVIGTVWNVGGGAAPQMWFTTGAAAAQYRMTIFGGGVTDFDGYVGMGNNLNPGFVPSSRLHLHQTGTNPNNIKFTNNATGPLVNDGLSIGIRGGGFGFYQNLEPNQPHAFFTHDGGTGTFERMRINAFNANGFIGMGNSAGFTATSQLHINTIGANIASAAAFGEVLRTDGVSNVDNSWRLFTGPTMAGLTQKGRVFTSNTGTLHSGGTIHPVGENFNLEATQADMVFWANGTRALGTTPALERMRITSENFLGTGDATRVGITRDATAVIADPRAMLHIGQAFNAPGQRGHRTWMDVGTYYGFNSDMMYVGQHRLATQQNNAIVAWGSEPINFNNPNPPGDRLLFRFMNDPTFGNAASGPNGQEIARMVSDGNNGRMSIGTPLGGAIDPGNTLEIISSAGSPQPAGLRFRNLNCASGTSPQCNPLSPVFLSVNNAGDVILVNAPVAPPASSLGNDCSALQNPLPNHWEIPMNSFNFYFSDPGGTANYNENSVFIGPNCGTSARGKLNVVRPATSNSNTFTMGSYVENNDVATSPFNGSGYGTYSVANGANATNEAVHGEAFSGSTNMGIFGMATDFYSGSSNGIQNYGVRGESREGLINYGVSGTVSTNNNLTQDIYAGDFRANGSTNASTLNSNYGVRSIAVSNNTTNDNIGVMSRVFNNGTVTNNVGVAGIASNSGSFTQNIGIYGEGTTGGYFTGGFVTSGTPIVFSDSRIKTNVTKVENGLELLKKLNPVTYAFKTTEYPELHLSDKMQYGFIAQEVEQVIPELVYDASKPEFKDEKGNIISKGGEFKGLAYEGLIPVLTQAIKEQQVIIEKQEETNKALNERLDQLEECINKLNLCNNQSTGNNLENNNTGNTIEVELTNAPSIVLDQNVPNPFAEQTVISFTLPQEVQKAQMLFYNNEGKLINSVDLNERGQGKLNVFASDLSNGIYTYTLVADGRIIDSKKMIRSK